MAPAKFPPFAIGQGGNPCDSQHALEIRSAATQLFFCDHELSLNNKEVFVMTDSYTIILDKDTVERIDAWRNQSLFEPSRRAATRALVRMALKVLQQKKDRAAVKAAAADDQAVAS